MREWRTRGLANDIEELTNALPKDEFTFSNYKEGDRISSLDLHVTDSPYDDTYVGGTRLKVSVNATRRGISMVNKDTLLIVIWLSLMMKKE